MKKIVIIAGIISAFSMAACNQTGSGRADGVDTALTDTTKLAEAVLPDSVNVAKAVDAYVVLKNALVSSNSDDAKKAAANLEDVLIEIQGCVEAATLSRNIAATDNISDQRKAFLTLSKDVITLAKGVKIPHATYVQYCPMANEGKGAFWLSESKEIRNPYYGDKMLKCGEVKEVIQ